MKKHIARGLAIILSASMIVGASGCGSTGKTGETVAVSNSADSENGTSTDGITAKDTLIQESASDNKSSEAATPAVITPIDDQGKPISDFDEFVNAEWKKQQEARNIGTVGSYYDEMTRMDERLVSILKDTDLSKVSEDDGLYKVVSLYRELVDTSDYDTRIATITEHLARIENVKSLDDLYELYGDAEYTLYNSVLRFEVESTSNGYNALMFTPDSFAEGTVNCYSLFTNPSDEQKEASEQYLALWEDLGYSRDRAVKVVENAMKVGSLIDEYRAHESDLFAHERSDLEEGSVTVPVIDILVNLHAFGKKRFFYARDNFAEFMNKVYKPENVEILRDQMIFTAVSTLMLASGSEYIVSDSGMDYDRAMFSVVSRLAPDVLNKEYQRLYVDSKVLEDAQAWTDDIKNVMREMISNSEWISTHGKELTKHKLLTMHANFGVNGHANYYEDAEHTDNTVENYINMLVCRDRFFKKQTMWEDEQRDLFNANLYEVNGRYFSCNNGFIITNGMLGLERLEKADSYEARLAYLGELIAHEMSHCYDPNSIDFNYHAYIEPWMTEDEQKAYSEIVMSMINFFDGMEIEYGEKIDGRLVCGEVFADILAVDCCLKLLEKQENPDYDKFFRACAEDMAFYYTPEGAAEAVKDEHLPGKQRINYILGQFDKFYEVYDIDENSPYFVPSDKRIKIF